MLSHLKNIFTPSSNPSALIVLTNFNAALHILHVIPENGSFERFSITTQSSAATFRHHGAAEKARERIGTVTLHVGDGEAADSFIDDVATRIRKLLDDCSDLSPTHGHIGTGDVTQLVQDVLKPAAMDAIHQTEGRERSVNATQAYAVFVVHISRSRAGAILGEPTSFPS